MDFVRIAIQDDAIPELEEDFTVTLGTPTFGRLGALQTLKVTILESDYPRGLVRFDPLVDVTLDEPSAATPLEVKLDINRAPGLFSSVDVSYSVMQQTRNGTLVPADSADISPTSGVVTLPAIVAGATFSVFVQADTVPEDEEVYHVVLSSDDTSVSTTDGTAVLRVRANDDANGVFGFLSASTQLEEALSGGRIPVHREAGRFGAAAVSWTLTSSSVSGLTVGEKFSNSSSATLSLVRVAATPSGDKVFQTDVLTSAATFATYNTTTEQVTLVRYYHEDFITMWTAPVPGLQHVVSRQVGGVAHVIFTSQLGNTLACSFNATTGMLRTTQPIALPAAGAIVLHVADKTWLLLSHYGTTLVLTLRPLC